MVIANRPVDEAEYLRLRELVTEKSGLEFPPSRRPQLEGAIASAVAELGLRDAGALWQRLTDEEGTAELEDFISSVTIGETYFFRDEPHFDALEHHVLPELLTRRRDTRRLRLWSAGCSSGEEPYSLAMLIDGLIPNDEGWDVTIVATDINRVALRRACEGIYRPWSLRRTSQKMRERYFIQRSDETWELDPRIRRMVDFRYVNLVDDRFPSLFTNIHAMDLIVCRNVLIYFADATVRAVVEKLHASLASDGWLVVGHAEASQGAFARFTPTNFVNAVLYQKKRGEPVAEPAEGSRRRDYLQRRDFRPRMTTRVPSLPHKWNPVEARPAPSIDLAAENRLRALEVKAAEHPDDPRPPYLLAKRLADRLDVPAATRWIAEALRRDELFAPAHYIGGLMAEEEGRFDDAISALRRCIYADHSWPLPHFALARCFLKGGRASRAAVALTNTLRLLEGRAADEPIAEGDGLTAGRLLELARIQIEVSRIAVPGVADGT